MNEEHGAITPPVIVRWMCLKVYCNPDPDLNNNLTQGRASSISDAKKAIYYFMLNRLVHWNELENLPVVNPTKSIPVDDLIKIVKIRRYENKTSRRRLGNGQT